MKETRDEQEGGEEEDVESTTGGEISQGEKSRDFISLCCSNVAVLGCVLGCFLGVPGRFRKPSGWNSLPAVCLPLGGSISIAPGLILQGRTPGCGPSQATEESGMHLDAKPTKNGWWRCSRKRHKFQDRARLFGIIHSIIPCNTSSRHCLHKWNFFKGCGPRFGLTWQLGKVSTHLEGAASHRAPAASGSPSLGTSWARGWICISAFATSWSGLSKPFYFWHLHPLGNQHQFRYTPCVAFWVFKSFWFLFDAINYFVLSTLLSAFSSALLISYPLLIPYFPTWKSHYSLYFRRKTHRWDCTRHLSGAVRSPQAYTAAGISCLSHIVLSHLMIMIIIMTTITWFLLKSGSACVWHFVLLTGDFNHHSLTRQLSSRRSPLEHPVSSFNADILMDFMLYTLLSALLVQDIYELAGRFRQLENSTFLLWVIPLH